VFPCRGCWLRLATSSKLSSAQSFASRQKLSLLLQWKRLGTTTAKPAACSLPADSGRLADPVSRSLRRASALVRQSESVGITALVTYQRRSDHNWITLGSRTVLSARAPPRVRSDGRMIDLTMEARFRLVIHEYWRTAGGQLCWPAVWLAPSLDRNQQRSKPVR